MRRPVILSPSPFIRDYYLKTATQLLAETGGNSGNLAFEFAVASHLPDGRILDLGTSDAEIRAAGDVVVLPLANQLGAHTDMGQYADRLQKIGLPVIGIGLGAQADKMGEDIELTPGTRRWLELIVSLAPSGAPNLGVRGEYTRRQIERLGFPNAAIVSGCPSNFLNTRTDIAASIEARQARVPVRIAVTAGIPYIAKLARLEQQLADLVTIGNGAYIVQHALEMLRLARGEFAEMPPEQLEQCRAYIAPDKSTEAFIAWCRTYAIAFYDARAWMDYLRNFDFVVGTRFHGAMFAIQTGTPAGCICHDSRTAEMCATMGMPYVEAHALRGAISRQDLPELFRFDAAAYRANRAALKANYVTVLDGAGLSYHGLG